MPVMPRRGASFARVVTGALALGLTMMSVTAPTHAAKGDNTSEPGELAAEATATVTIQGEARGGTATASAPALCWWDKTELTTEFLAAFTTVVSVVTWGGYSAPASAVAEVVEAEKADGAQRYEWYVRRFREGASEAELQAAGCNDPSGPFQGGFIGQTLRPFLPGQPPQPLPDPVTMAETAIEYLDVVEPSLDWNPRVGQLGGGTLVRLPTWFWATDPERAVGGTDGQRTVTATAGSGDYQVSVTVTAVAGQLKISTPVEDVRCSSSAAQVAYSPGADESTACTLTFPRASTRYPDGFPVTATVEWTAAWTGTGPGVPAGPQSIEGTTQTWTGAVPVGEAQSVVTEAR